MAPIEGVVMTDQIQEGCPVEHNNILDFVTRNAEYLQRSNKFSAREEKVQSKIATKLDAALEDMVVGMEGIASCQQEVRKRLTVPSPMIESFCVGMEHLSRSLFPHLELIFIKACAEENIESHAARIILQSRLEALSSYMLQLTQVHGLVLEHSDEGSPTPVMTLRIALKKLAKDTLANHI